MKTVSQILNECVFDKSIEQDIATVTVNVAEEAMRRYAKATNDSKPLDENKLKDLLLYAFENYADGYDLNAFQIASDFDSWYRTTKVQNAIKGLRDL